MHHERASAPLFSALTQHPPHAIKFECENLGQWDSSLVAFILKLISWAHESEVKINLNTLPNGVKQLVTLSKAVPMREEKHEDLTNIPFLVKVGVAARKTYNAGQDMIQFMGEISLSVLRLFKGQARYRLSDLFYYIQECSSQALPIVSLISLLVGLILAFVAAIQLEQFGAQIYVANLVGVGMAREMAPIMTGIIMAGRTGAAYAAQLGTMQVNEEIDALRTTAIAPIDFLVLPRITALVLMMPLLVIYADMLGMLGGAFVAGTMLDISFTQYLNQTKYAVMLKDLYIGIVKGAVFGILVGIAGCMRGIQCGRSAQAVGVATTSAVVTAIVFIIVADAVFAVVLHALDL